MNIQASLHHILESKETLADLFYLVFLDQYPEVRKHFEGVNLRTQGMLLTMALMVMERHYSGPYPATEMYLKYLGSKHHERGIAPELFPKFRNALLAALERFHGKDWSTPLAGQWTDAIEGTSRTMLEGYRERVHV
jgi:hemoglobin-like flavoprotein